MSELLSEAIDSIIDIRKKAISTAMFSVGGNNSITQSGVWAG